MNTMIINVKHLIFFVTITVVCLVFAASCGNTKPSGGDKKDDTLAIKPIIDTVELVTSLEELYSYAPKNTVIETCDLSHLGLKEIPMLRQYNIKSLDLSNNEMRMFEGYRLFLPPNVENLYLDSCYIGDIRREDYCAKEDFTTSSRLIDYSVRLCFDEEEFPNLKMIDVSYNKINRIEVPEYTKILNTHYNDFKSIKNKVRETSNGMTNIKRDTVRMVTSVEDLYGLAPNTIIEVCDLSNQGLKKLPVLRPYNILKLDVSENNFDELNREERQYSSWKAMLPQSIRELKMNNSYNGALVRNTEYGKRSGGAYLLLRKNELPYLKTINISNNFIGGLYISAPAVHVNVSRNDLRKIEIKTNTINYLDVSYNWNMDKGIRVSPESIDTLKTDSCAHGMKLGKTNGLIEL